MSSATMLTPSQAIKLVAVREIEAKVRSKAFLAITAVLLFSVVGTVLLFHFLSPGANTSVEKVGVTANTAQFQQPLIAAGQGSGRQIEVSMVDRPTGEQLVRDGKLAALLVDTPEGAVQAVVKSELPAELQTVFSALVRQAALNQQIAALGGDPSAVQQAISAATVAVHPLEKVDEHRSARIGMSAVVGILSYVMLLISIQLTGQGVVEEKANRIVELLLSTIRPWELLAGKVLGVGVVTIGQVALLAVAGVGTALATGILHLSAAAITGVAAWALVWYLLGYFLYALVIAAAASLISRQEDLAAVATPISVVVISAYLIGQTIVPGNPNGTAATVLSMIPLFSPVLMPMRVAYDVPGWQLAVALVLTLLTTVLVARLAGRIYGNAVLLTGSRVSLRTALKVAG